MTSPFRLWYISCVLLSDHSDHLWLLHVSDMWPFYICIVDGKNSYLGVAGINGIAGLSPYCFSKIKKIISCF